MSRRADRPRRQRPRHARVRGRPRGAAGLPLRRAHQHLLVGADEGRRVRGGQLRRPVRPRDRRPREPRHPRSRRADPRARRREPVPRDRALRGAAVRGSRDRDRGPPLLRGRGRDPRARVDGRRTEREHRAPLLRPTAEGRVEGDPRRHRPLRRVRLGRPDGLDRARERPVARGPGLPRVRHAVLSRRPPLGSPRWRGDPAPPRARRRLAGRGRQRRRPVPDDSTGLEHALPRRGPSRARGAGEARHGGGRAVVSAGQGRGGRASHPAARPGPEPERRDPPLRHDHGRARGGCVRRGHPRAGRQALRRPGRAGRRAPRAREPLLGGPAPRGALAAPARDRFQGRGRPLPPGAAVPVPHRGVRQSRSRRGGRLAVLARRGAAAPAAATPRRAALLQAALRPRPPVRRR